jgi:hypothetical protein
MIRVLILFLVCVQVSYGQLSEFKDPELLEQKKRTDNYRQNKVRTKKTIKFQSLTDVEGNSRGVLKEIDSLDRNGYLVCAIDIHASGRQTIMRQTFDALGNLLGFRQYLNEKLNHESRFYYDENQNLVSRVTINSNGKIDSVIQQDRTQFIGNKKITTNGPGAFAAKTVEEWDSSTRIYTSTTFGQNGQPFQITEIRINDKGWMESKTYVKSIGSKVYSLTYVYNQNGHLSEERSYDKNNLLIQTTKNEYDERGLPVKEIQLDAAGQISDVMVYEYDFYQK